MTAVEVSDEDLAEFDRRLGVAREREAAVDPVLQDGRRVVWAPQEGSQSDFMQCPLFECLYHGTRGPGKTDALLMAFAQHVGRGYRDAWRGIIFRQTYPQLADVQAKSEKWFRRIFPGARFNRGKMQWEFASGETLLFRHMARRDDYWNYHGHEYPFIGFEELTNWSSDDCFRLMLSCCRSPTAGVPHMVRATTNPYGPGHNWVKDRYRLHGRWWETVFVLDAKAEDGTPEHPRCAIHGHIDENLILLRADPKYKATIAASASNKGQLAAWLDGSWDFVAGGMFDDVWSPRHNVFPDFDVPASWRLDRSFDWGSARPFSVGWWAQSDGSDVRLRDGRVFGTVRGDLFRVREWYGWSGKPNEGQRMLAIDVARGIVERELLWDWRGPRGCRVQAGPADSSIFAVENGVGIALDMAKPVRVGNGVYSGVQWVAADKSPGSRKNGWELMRRMIANARPRPGLPREAPGLFVVGSQCAQFLRTVITLPRDEKDLDDVDCFVAGTMVATPCGPRPIESIVAGDIVDTPIGPRSVTRSYLSGAASTVRVALSNGHLLQGTARHKIYVPGHGLTRLDELACGTILIPETTCDQETEATACWRCGSAASSTGSTRRGATSSADVGMRNGLASPFFIGPSGDATEDRFPPTCTCTTDAEATTRSGTWNSSRRPITRACISPSVGTRSRLSRWRGQTAPRGGDSCERTLAECLQNLQNENLRALVVACLLSRSTRPRSTAATSVLLPPALACSGSAARSVASSSGASPIAARRFRRAPTRVVGICADATPRDVFNLTVRQAGLFFAAGGVLCSNTDAEDHIADEVRYKVRSCGAEVRSLGTTGMF